MVERIRQIIPAAPGYYAHYVGPRAASDPEPEPHVVQNAYWPIAAWAVLEEDGTGITRVVGVDMTGVGPAWTPAVNPADNLAEYVYFPDGLDPNGTPRPTPEFEAGRP